ncbi:MAG: GGDEF domain-containing protein [Clostridiales bacterium]|nr:GGDEF domain-containing protein [Clostridiales bacterium]
MKISALISLLCLMIMAYSGYGLFLGWTNYRQATRLGLIQKMTQSFADGLKNFMFERGRMNVVLSKEQPISQENRSFLNERRSAADKAFEAGLLVMEDVFPEKTKTLRKDYENIHYLRIKIDEQAEKPLRQREAGAKKIWFDSCTDYINTVITKINVIRQLSRNQSNISYCFDVVVDSLSFRNIVGNEATMITAAIAAQNPLGDDDLAAIQMLRGKEAQVWSDLEKTIGMLDSAPLTMALENVREQYYNQFLPQQTTILEQARKGLLQEGADQKIASVSVPVLDSILNLSDEAVRAIEGENSRSIEYGLMGLIAGLGHTLVGLLIVILIPVYFRKRFVDPLHDIVQNLNEIRDGKVDCRIPHTQRADEIGKLAHVADMLKNSMIVEQTLKQELEKTVLMLQDLSLKDSLTGLYNRRYLHERFEEMMKRYRRNGSIFSVIMCDIDMFKSINDQYGHECGDSVLIHVSDQLSANCRESDVIARWGGEEFLLLLPDTDREGAKVLAEKLRTVLAGKEYKWNHHNLEVTMTFGVAQYSGAEDIQETIRKADMALLQGKNNGRNQIVAF